MLKVLQQMSTQLFFIVIITTNAILQSYQSRT